MSTAQIKTAFKLYKERPCYMLLMNLYCTVLKYVLRKQPSWFVPSRNENSPIMFACIAGDLEAVDQLLEIPTVHPNHLNNLPFVLAIRYGHTLIVKRLLGDKRLDPEGTNKHTWHLAVIGGHTEIVKLLLQDDRLIPTVESMVVATAKGDVEIFNLLLSKFVPMMHDFIRLLHMACSLGQVAIVSFLLDEIHVTPNVPVLNEACNYGHIEVVKLLLPLVTDGFETNQAHTLRIAAENGHVDIVRVIAADPRISLRKARIMTLLSKAKEVRGSKTGPTTTSPMAHLIDSLWEAFDSI